MKTNKTTKNFIFLTVPFIFFCLVAVISNAENQSSANYQIEVDVIDSGGNDSYSTNYDLLDSLGQSTAIGVSSSSNYYNYAGYLYALSGAGVTYSAIGSGNNYPVPLFRASLSVNVTSSSLGTSTLSYYYTRNRLYLVNTSITGITVVDGTATITGTGKVNNISGYTFTATITDSNPDAIGLEIYTPGGSLYFSTGGTKPVNSGNFTVAGQ